MKPALRQNLAQLPYAEKTSARCRTDRPLPASQSHSLLAIPPTTSPHFGFMRQAFAAEFVEMRAELYAKA